MTVDRPDHVPAELVYRFDYIDDPALVAEPHERMRQIAVEAPPLFWTPHHGGHWVVRSRALLAEITLDPGRFSNRSRGIPDAGRDIDLLPLTYDPPEHTLYRMPLNRFLSARAVAPLEPAIRDMTHRLIDEVAGRPGCNLLHAVAEPLPVILFMTMAGMPTDRLHEFRQLAEQATADPDGQARGHAFARISAILSETVRARMQRREDDLISRLIDSDLDGAKPSFAQVVSYAVLLFLGGLETVVNAIAFAMRHLATDQALQDRLRADLALIPAAVEELLRLHGIAMSVRRVTADTSVGGVDLREADRILLLVPAANYDPAGYRDAASFCPGRREPHVTFNTGPHRCVGANLARLELRVFLEAWLHRIPRFRLDPAQPPRFMGGLNLAVRSLDLLWD